MSLEILVVDDNEADQFLCDFMIKNVDGEANIHKAYDGQEALDVLNTLKGGINMIFVDINMPRMNGFEFLEAYQSSEYNQSSVVFMLTSSLQETDKNRCESFPQVKGFMSKPLSVDSVQHCISQWL